MPKSRKDWPDVDTVPGLYIETQHWPAKRGVPKPTLVITVDALVEILSRETGVLAPDDAPALARAFAYYARGMAGSEDDAIDAFYARTHAYDDAYEDEEE